MPKGIYERDPLMIYGNKGKHHREETKRKMSEAHLGKKLSEETKRKIGLKSKGRIPTEETIQKLRDAQIGNKHTEESKQKIRGVSLGRKHTEESKLKMSEARKGKPATRKGFKLTEEHKRKMRESAIKRIEEQVFNGLPIIPTIGKTETQILDNLEKKIGFKIKRQHRVNGYFLDGYCEELNLAVEVDEKHHARQKEKDLIRENNIKNELNCEFIRLNDDL